MKKRYIAAAICVVLFAAFNLAKKPKLQTSDIFAMDTVISISAYGSREAVDEAEREIYRIDNQLNPFSEGSEIWQLNHNDGEWLDISAQTAEQIEYALRLSSETDGAFDLTVFPASNLWGFGNDDYKVPTNNELANVKSRIGFEKIQLDSSRVRLLKNAEISLGSIAKGYTAQRIAEIFHEKGVKSAIVSLGGNIAAIGTKPNGSKWNVAVTNPFETGEDLCCAELESCFVSTSGDYNRFFEVNGKHYHHIIDPKTCCPADNGVRQVTIICAGGMAADALSTAMFVLGADKAAEFWRTHRDFEMIIVTQDRKIILTDGLKECIRDLNEEEFEIAYITP